MDSAAEKVLCSRSNTFRNMKTLQKAVIILPLVAFIALAMAPAMVSAQPAFGTPPVSVTLTGETQVYTLLGKIFTIVYTIFFAVASFMILFAAFTYLTAGGDETKVGKAKNVLVYAVIAIVVALISLSIGTFVRSIIA